MVRGVIRIGNPIYIWRHTTPIPNEPIFSAVQRWLNGLWTARD